jgi:predicted Zn-ribbon and HTH transcriptional regulator
MRILIRKLYCNKCGHEWTPRIRDVRQCPRCKSAKWDIKVSSYTIKHTREDAEDNKTLKP